MNYNNFVQLDSINWASLQVVNHAVWRINNSKLMMFNDQFILKHIKSTSNTVNPSQKCFWTVSACCAATIGTIISFNKNCLWPALLSLTPGLYALCQFIVIAIHKENIDKLLHLLCINQTSLFGVLECIGNNIIIKLLGSDGLVISPLQKSDILEIVENTISLMIDINQKLRMRQQIPSNTLVYVGYSNNLDKVSEMLEAYEYLQDINNCYSAIISKLLLDFQLTFTVKEYDATNAQKQFVICNQIPTLIDLMEWRVTRTFINYKNMHCRTRYPLNSRMYSLYETIEWYNKHLNELTVAFTRSSNLQNNQTSSMIANNIESNLNLGGENNNAVKEDQEEIALNIYKEDAAITQEEGNTKEKSECNYANKPSVSNANKKKFHQKLLPSNTKVECISNQKYSDTTKMDKVGDPKKLSSTKEAKCLEQCVMKEKQTFKNKCDSQDRFTTGYKKESGQAYKAINDELLLECFGSNSASLKSTKKNSSANKQDPEAIGMSKMKKVEPEDVIQQNITRLNFIKHAKNIARLMNEEL